MAFFRPPPRRLSGTSPAGKPSNGSSNGLSGETTSTPTGISDVEWYLHGDRPEGARAGVDGRPRER